MKYLIPLLFLATTPASADPAQILEVTAAQTASGWRFDVTLSHADTGWEDYADGWRVELADGTIAATRPLTHPHVDEQPFTRGTSGVSIPEDTTQVFVRARTNTDGWSDTTAPYTLPR
ncbi:hypothetical protein [Gymnodinialimonas sp. 57CJ19]|uniref:hypothetical protein n=1 Tax=Gymnodinialimonas sp. 57CJ19 TaxID=3138498 RepID=UPI0031344AAC